MTFSAARATVALLSPHEVGGKMIPAGRLLRYVSPQ